MGQGILVICPAYNEEASVFGVVTEIQQALEHAEILVVDDGSRDRTAAIARAAGARAIRLPFNVGVGGATRAGLLYAERENFEVVVQCDADGQHPAKCIASLVEPLEEADFVIGSRWAGGGSFPSHGPRRWAMKVLGALLSRMHGTSLTDVTSGFRAFGPRAISVYARQLPPEYLADTVDALVIAKKEQLRVREIPVEMRERLHGAPSTSALKATLYLGRCLLILVLSYGRPFKKLSFE